jgi:hypothetical protein
MTAGEETITISARRRVQAGAAETFAFLAAPATHRRLQVRGIASLSLDGDDLLRGGVIRLRGPLGLRRAVRTHVALHQPATRLAATTLVESGTAAYVSWTLEAQDDGSTIVELTAVLGPIAQRDRLLLALGGRRWIRRLFAATLRKLAAELVSAPRWRAAEPASDQKDGKSRLPLRRHSPPFPARSQAGAV